MKYGYQAIQEYVRWRKVAVPIRGNEIFKFLGLVTLVGRVEYAIILHHVLVYGVLTFAHVCGRARVCARAGVCVRIHTTNQ